MPAEYATAADALRPDLAAERELPSHAHTHTDVDLRKLRTPHVTYGGEPSAGALADAADPLLQHVLVALAAQKVARLALARAYEHAQRSPLGFAAAVKLSAEVLGDPELCAGLTPVADAALALVDELLSEIPSPPSAAVIESTRLAAATAE